MQLPRAQALYKAGLGSIELLVAAGEGAVVRALRTAHGAALEEPALRKHSRVILEQARLR